MRVSVIVSSYNYDRYVEESIESALNQTYPDVEVVIVDDGSTDNSPEIIRRYEGRAKLLFKPNGGQASAFNFAYRECTGDLILFLDCDDALRADCVEKCVAAWRPGCSKVHFPLEVITDDGTRTGALVPRAHLPQGNFRQQLLEEGMYVAPPNTGNIFSRELLDRILPMPENEFAYAPDSYLIFLAPLHGSVGAVQEPLGLYRRHVRSVTNITLAERKEVGAKLKSMARSFKELRELLEEHSLALGLDLSPRAVSGHWLCLKVRLAMSRVAPELDPFGSPGTAKLLWPMLGSVWQTSELGFLDRCWLSTWALLVALLPVAAAIVLIKFAFAPGERATLIRKTLGLSEPRKASPAASGTTAR
ncbi:MAG: glycosyltransferase [Bryobacteraceae bacterium]